MASLKTEELADHLFRHEYGKMVAVLSRIFGFENPELIEDVIQDAFVTALQTWKYNATPRNPSAWLMQVAKRKAIDILRRNQLHQTTIDQHLALPVDLTIDSFFHEDEIADNQLRLIFACCHPALKEADQIALTLKMISGFGIREIAQALLTTVDAIKARLSRARKFIRREEIPLEIPTGKSLDERIFTVLTVLYLIFNEGYYSTQHEQIIRRDLCDEALRLTKQLCAHKRGDQPPVHALIALMSYHASRLTSRTDTQGNTVLLPDQDRSLWDQDLISQGHIHLQLASRTKPFGNYHIEAAIAAQHCLAPSFAETDWQTLLSLYDVLYTMKKSSQILLNKVVVLMQLKEYDHAQHLLLQLTSDLDQTVMFHSVFASLEMDVGHAAEAENHLKKAIQLSTSPLQKAFLEEKLSAVNSNSTT
ncbi:MAG: sigma-70 family RNA polymerase sigma factor [Saprospiraceae bacterium]|nr:sigma-70 family RNA polymerase sigma factor [Saprospiraceae bacterium]